MFLIFIICSIFGFILRTFSEDTKDYYLNIMIGTGILIITNYNAIIYELSYLIIALYFIVTFIMVPLIFSKFIDNR
jgi:hypothetical protein